MAEEQNNQNGDLRDLINKLLVSHEELKKDVQADMLLHATTKDQISDLSTQVRVLRRDVDRIQRGTNLFIYNIPESASNDADLLSTLRSILEKVSISIPDLAVDTIRRKGRSPGKRPIFVCFISPSWVHKIFAKARELRKLGVYLENDLTPEQRAQRREAQQAHRTLRAAGLDSSLKKGNLFIDGKAVTRSDFPAIMTRARQNTGAPAAGGENPPSGHSIPSPAQSVSPPVSHPSITLALTSSQEFLSSTSTATDVQSTADQAFAQNSPYIPSSQTSATSLSELYGTSDPGIESLLTYAEAVSNEHMLPHFRLNKQSPTMKSRTFKRKQALPYPKTRKHLKSITEDNCSASNKITNFLVQTRDPLQLTPSNIPNNQQQMTIPPSLPPAH